MTSSSCNDCHSDAAQQFNAASRDVAIAEAEAELDAVITRLRETLRASRPELFDGNGELRAQDTSP